MEKTSSILDRKKELKMSFVTLWFNLFGSIYNTYDKIADLLLQYLRIDSKKWIDIKASILFGLALCALFDAITGAGTFRYICIGFFLFFAVSAAAYWFLGLVGANID